jgi:iron(III) transport system substrate-binding protein
VVVYTTHDQIYSEPIFRAFEEKTGIRVDAVYDTEATKTVGLANRLAAEASNPQCDVFWNNEVVRTVILKRKGVLERYVSESSRDIPAGMKDPEGFWAGFASRARVLVVNTNLVASKDTIATFVALADPQQQGKVAMAYPLFGTTATHAAVLFSLWGDAKGKEFFQKLKANGVKIVDGNGAAKDMVARGEASYAMCDTDDAYSGIHDGNPLRMIFLDQGTDGPGTVVIPNTASLVKNCPHPEVAKKFIDFLLSREVEGILAKSGSAQMPVRAGIPTPADVPTLSSIKAIPVDWEKVADKQDEVAAFLSDLFVR